MGLSVPSSVLRPVFANGMWLYRETRTQLAGSARYQAVMLFAEGRIRVKRFIQICLTPDDVPFEPNVHTVFY